MFGGVCGGMDDNAVCTKMYTSTEFPVDAIPMPADLQSPPRGGMPQEDKTSWGHGATPPPRLHHSQSFCAAEALTQFWREEGTQDGVGAVSGQHRTPPPYADWSLPKGGLYVLQPPPPPPLASPLQGLFSPPMREAVECDSSTLSHATPFKPLGPRLGDGRPHNVYEP